MTRGAFPSGLFLLGFFFLLSSQVKGICHNNGGVRDLSLVVTGSKDSGTFDARAYDRARMVFEPSRHLVITNDLLQWVKQEADLPQA